MTTQFLKENLSYEFQVMLAGLQAHLKAAPIPDWQTILAHPIDWSHVLELCHYHEVSPLVYESLKNQTGIQEETLQKFKRQVLKNKQLSLRFTQSLKDLLIQFAHESIEVLPYKGVGLSEELFNDVTKRPTKDLDLVVKRQDYLHIKTILTEQGFKGPFTKDGELATATTEKQLLTGCRHLNFFGRGGIALELHFELFPPDKHSVFTVADVWNDLENSSFSGQSIKVLSHEQLVLALTTHAANHIWKRLKWLFDIAVLLDRGKSTETLIQTSQQEQVETILRLNTTLCQTLFNLPPPNTLTHSSADNALERLRFKVVKQFKTWPHDPPMGFSRLKLRMGLCDSLDLRTSKNIVEGLIMRDQKGAAAPAYFQLIAHPVRSTVKHARQLLNLPLVRD